MHKTKKGKAFAFPSSLSFPKLPLAKQLETVIYRPYHLLRVVDLGVVLAVVLI